ncbi:VWA domain-containing protein [Candidatus Acetothermia bacterium]|nr:VWA domain-containing protein [Candidatus Acetothermia bacterium]
MHTIITRKGAWLGWILVMVLVILGLKSSVAWGTPTTQLVFIVDGSGSISSADFTTVKSGIAAAILAQIPTDGSIEITVVQFAGDIVGDARVEVPPTAITSSTVRSNVATTIQNITKANGTTPMAAGINLAKNTICNPSCRTDAIQIFNIETDGNPNVPSSPAGAAVTAAINARIAAVSAGVDEFDAEGVGDAVLISAFKNFLCDLVFPRPSPDDLAHCAQIAAPTLTGFPPRNSNGIGTQGFVLLIQSFSDFATAVNKKLDIIIISPPVADAGPVADGDPNDTGHYACQVNQQITLDGTGSFDPDNQSAANKGITAFAWSFVSGPTGGTFDNNAIAQPKFTCPGTTGTVVVNLTVTKTGGLTNSDPAQIVVSSQPVGPNANAGADTSCRANQTKQLDGTGSSDPDNSGAANKGIKSFLWEIQSGGGSLTNANTATPTLTCPSSGTVVVKLTVTDSDDNLTDTDTVNVNVTAPVGPIADAGGPYICTPGQTTIQLDGTGSKDPDNNVPPNKGIASFSWDLDNNGTFGDSTSAKPTTSCPATDGTVKTVKLRVTDSDDNLTNDAIATITTPRLCQKTGKVDDLLSEVLKKGFPFKDLFVELLAQLNGVSTDLGDILDTLTPDATDTEIDDAIAKLTAIGSVADFIQPFIDEINSARLEYECEIDVLKTLLPQAITQKKFGKTTGTRILRQLDLMKKLLDQLAQALVALQTKLKQVDSELNKTIDALNANDVDAAATALAKALKLVDSAVGDVGRMLRKQLSQLLKAQDSIGQTFKIELNTRTAGHRKSSEPWIVIEQGTMMIQGASVSDLTVEVYALNGVRLAQSHTLSDRLALETLVGRGRADGVYLYIVKITDKDGRSWKSELRKLVWMRP